MANFDLIGDYAIRKGVTFDIATFYYPDDISDWLPRGKIKKTYYSDVLVEFTFAPLIYGPVTLPDETIGDRTLIIPILSASQTSSLPETAHLGRTPVKGFNVWVYDIELESPNGKVIQLTSGHCQVLPEVTT